MRFFLFLILLIPMPLFAQINESDSLKFKGKLSLTGFWQDGNVETLIFRGRADMSVRPWKNWVFKTQNSYVYQEFGKQKADEDILSLNFLYIHPEKRVYPFALAFVSTNFRRKINLRYIFGAGTTFQLINNDKYLLKLSVSSEYEETDFIQTTFNKTEYNGERFINTFRGTIWMYGKYHFFDRKMILYHENYFQPSLEQSNNFRWQADIGLELPLWKWISFKMNYLYTYESIVIENQKPEDSILSFGVSIRTSN